MEYTIENLANAIRDAVNWLIEVDEGCVTIPLDERLAVCVGWISGYEDDKGTVILSKKDKGWGITAGVRVWTSDSLRTDLDWINCPYWSNGDVWDDTVGINLNVNYEALAKFFLADYRTLKEFEIDEDGLVEGELIW